MVRSLAVRRGRGPARNSFVASDEQRHLVDVMAAAGIALADIAAAVTPGGGAASSKKSGAQGAPGGVSLATLRRHFAGELRHGRAKAHGAVARSLFQQACKGNVAACRLWLDRHAPAANADAGVNNKDDIAQVLDRLVAGSRSRLERQLARLAAAGEAGQVSP